MKRLFIRLGMATIISQCCLSRLNAKIFTRITAEGGTLTYNLKSNEGNGWYAEPTSAYRFKVGFKQAERDSADPMLVATLQPTRAEHFRGHESLELQIAPRTESRSKRAAYKVAIASFKPQDPFRPSVLEAKDWYHGFAMKIDGSYFKLPQGKGEQVIFEQFHQGSPFHPPLSLAMVSRAEAIARGWKDAGKDGNFALIRIDDDHGPLSTLAGAPELDDLGPVLTGQWIQWVVHVRPSPDKMSGAVTIYLNGAVKLDLKGIRVGYDPSNPQYAKHKPPPYFDYADVLIYRINGDNEQRIFFDEIRFADTLEDATCR